MQDRAGEIIQNVISSWLGDKWERLTELANDAESSAKLSLLQDRFREADVPALTRDELVNLLRESVWSAIRGDDIRSPQVASLLLLNALTLGEQHAVALAQQAAGMKLADGMLGPQTLAALNQQDPERFISEYASLLQDDAASTAASTAETSKAFTSETTPETQNTQSSTSAFAQQTQTANASLNEAVQRPRALESVFSGYAITDAERENLEQLMEEGINQVGEAGPRLKDIADQVERRANNAIDALHTSDEEKASLRDSIHRWLDQYRNPSVTSTLLEQFNVDAIAKKSTSDIWTIEDQLGYESYAQAIAKMIVEGKAQPPLTVSIQAPWGQGKTSLMRMIKHKLEHGLDENKAKPQVDETSVVPGTQAKLNDLKDWIKQEPQAEDAMLKVVPGTIPCVWFNPLYFQNCNQVWSGLAHAILQQLVEQLPNQFERERFWFRLRLARLDTHAIRRDIHKLVLERLLPMGWKWFAILVLILIPQILTNLPFSGFLKSNSWLTYFPIAGALTQWLLAYLRKDKDWALDDKLAKYIKEPDYAKDMGLLHLVDHDLDRALALLLGEHGRLVVFIDDLDRCTPATVSDILLAINQFISVQHRKLYFILGMDTHMVAMAIETASEKQAATYNKNRHTSKGYGWRFMEKFVQLPFFIPRIQATEARKFMDTLLREKREDVVAKTAIDDIKVKIAGSANLEELQRVVTSFKDEHNVEILPEVDASVAAKMIDITSDQTGETLNKLIAAAMTDLELNPREIKRFLNVARLLFTRLDREADVSSDEHMLKVVRASHLILNWPQCLRWLQGNARSYTVQGSKTDPVESLEKLLDNPGIDNYEKWRTSIEATWGDTVAETIAQPDFYTFTRRIHDNPPNLQDIFKARVF